MGVICTYLQPGKSFTMPAYDYEKALLEFGIQPTDRVLDVGGGDNPFRRADIVAEAFLGDAQHRDGRAIINPQQQYVECFAEEMPFSDKEFDFVYCNHVLEHTVDPAAACRELMRVAKRGYLEVPAYWSESLNGHPTHRWLMFWENGRLVFRTKPWVQQPVEWRSDTPFAGLVERYWHADPEFRRLWQQDYRNLWTIQILWDDRFEFLIEERPVQTHMEVGLPGANAFGPNYPGRLDQAMRDLLGLQPNTRTLELVPGGPYPERLPFEDQSFDFVYCADTLQRAADPAAACAELIRVAKHGFIEIPHLWTEYLLGDPESRWLVELVDGVLTFRRRPFIQAPFKQLLRKDLYHDPLFRERFEQKFRNVQKIQLHWQGSFEYQVIDEVGFDYADPKQAGMSHLVFALNDLSRAVPLDVVRPNLERAIELMPDSARAWFELARCHETAGDREQSRSCMAQAHALEPDNPKFRLTEAALPGISAIVHTLNEEQKLEAALQSLQGWVDEIIVVDMHSEDRTVEIARRYTDRVILHERIRDFDAARNFSASQARHQWVFYLDADERVPERLGPMLREIVLTQGQAISGIQLPYKNYFAGRWIQHAGGWWPGYKAPMLLKNGTFRWGGRMHAPPEIDGPVMRFPHDDSELAITHFSYDSLSHYLQKVNSYTDAEADYLNEDGQRFHWKQAIAGFVQDFHLYYDVTEGKKDGPHGMILSLLSGVYRFATHAKLFERRFLSGQLTSAEQEVPASMKEVLHYALSLLPAADGPAIRQRTTTTPVSKPNALPADLPALGSVDPALKPGITAIVHTLNEEQKLEAALQSLQGWVDEIIVVDMHSEDRTVEIARRYTDRVILHERIRDFDAARNFSAGLARHQWVFYLDADERVSPELAAEVRRQVETLPESISAVYFPRKNHYVGKWIQHAGNWWPGYTAPMLLRKGFFWFLGKMHSGVAVLGQAAHPECGPEKAITHLSYDGIRDHIRKLDTYTEAEAAYLVAEGQAFDWQESIEGFVRDFRYYYDQTHGHRDGVHGLLLAFFSGLYRFTMHAKLFERRYQQTDRRPEEDTVPPSVQAILQYALSLLEDAPQPQAVVWQSPLLDPSGYADEARNFVLGLDAIGALVKAVPLAWSDRVAPLADATRDHLQALIQREVPAGYVSVQHIFPPYFMRDPQAVRNIGRTMFETDRLPADWVSKCNEMDEVWVPSDFNLETFAAAGVSREKLVKIPEALDAELYRKPVEPLPVEGRRGFNFLSIFDWSLRKGWDVLLRAYLTEFSPDDDVALVLKAHSSLGRSLEELQAEVLDFIENTLGADPERIPDIIFLDSTLSEEAMLRLYKSCDAYVMPSRGEGWGRPLMEAMAMGLPTIGTGWSGNTEFMTPENSYLVEYELTEISEAACREAGTFRGHRWAEPSVDHLRRIMRHVFTDRTEARARGATARQDVLTNLDRRVVAQQIETRLSAKELL